MHCQGKCCDNCICFSFSIQKKKKIPDAHLICTQWNWVESGSVPQLHHVAACPPWPAQSRTWKGIGERKSTRRLSSTVNHREPLCLQLPSSEELCRAETMALLWSCISSTSSTASDEWWVKRAADFGCTTLKYFIRDGKTPCASTTQQILPFAVQQIPSSLLAPSEAFGSQLRACASFTFTKHTRKKTSVLFLRPFNCKHSHRNGKSVLSVLKSYAFINM